MKHDQKRDAFSICEKICVRLWLNSVWTRSLATEIIVFRRENEAK